MDWTPRGLAVAVCELALSLKLHVRTLLVPTVDKEYVLKVSNFQFAQYRDGAQEAILIKTYNYVFGGVLVVVFTERPLWEGLAPF